MLVANAVLGNHDNPPALPSCTAGMPGPATISGPICFFQFEIPPVGPEVQGSRAVAPDSCPAPEFFSKAPLHFHPKRKSRRQMSAACACSSLAVGSTATAAAPCPHPRLCPEWADDRHPAAAFHPQKRQAPPHAGPSWTCSEAYTEQNKRAHADGISRLIHSSVGSDCWGSPGHGCLCSSGERGRGAFLRPREGILCPRWGSCPAWWLGKGKCWALVCHRLGRMLRARLGLARGFTEQGNSREDSQPRLRQEWDVGVGREGGRCVGQVCATQRALELRNHRLQGGKCVLCNTLSQQCPVENMLL